MIIFAWRLWPANIDRRRVERGSRVSEGPYAKIGTLAGVAAVVIAYLSLAYTAKWYPFQESAAASSAGSAVGGSTESAIPTTARRFREASTMFGSHSWRQFLSPKVPRNSRTCSRQCGAKSLARATWTVPTSLHCARGTGWFTTSDHSRMETKRSNTVRRTAEQVVINALAGFSAITKAMRRLYAFHRRTVRPWAVTTDSCKHIRHHAIHFCLALACKRRGRCRRAPSCSSALPAAGRAPACGWASSTTWRSRSSTCALTPPAASRAPHALRSAPRRLQQGRPRARPAPAHVLAADDGYVRYIEQSGTSVLPLEAGETASAR